MKSGFKHICGLFIGAALMAATAAGSVSAQSLVNRVDAKKDWSIFTAKQDGAKVCWIVTRPQDSVARRGGKPVSVQRGDIFLMVAIRPASGVDNEVSMVAGYPFKAGEPVRTTIGSKRFEMFTRGERAWAEDASDDNRMVAAMKAGVSAKVIGYSSRGTQTTDTFSLSGFTDALASARRLCN